MHSSALFVSLWLGLHPLAVAIIRRFAYWTQLVNKLAGLIGVLSLEYPTIFWPGPRDRVELCGRYPASRYSSARDWISSLTDTISRTRQALAPANANPSSRLPRWALVRAMAMQYGLRRKSQVRMQ